VIYGCGSLWLRQPEVALAIQRLAVRPFTMSRYQERNLASFVTTIVVSAVSLFVLFWVAQTLVHRRRGIKASVRHLLIPLILVGLVFGIGYVVTRLAPTKGTEDFPNLQDEFLVLQGIIALVFLMLGTLVLLLRGRRQAKKEASGNPAV
jgi:heme/copper-type cytochrome/quinol oxidase subunit 2